MKAICPGSFDPITFGHLDVITRAATLYDEVIVAVGTNLAKKNLLSQNQRIDLIRQACAGLDNVQVSAVSGLLVDYCRDNGVRVIVKGLRSATDFEYEVQMAHVNSVLAGIETVFLPSAPQWSVVSSTMIREVARLGGDVSSFVPAAVATGIRRALDQQS